jgi:uncharacterized membrane protein
MNRYQDFLPILIASALMYGLRLSGLLLGARLPRSGRAKRMMDALPGAIFAAIVLPGALSAGWVGVTAAAGTAICTRKTGNVLLGMLVGVGLVALLRR